MSDQQTDRVPREVTIRDSCPEFEAVTAFRPARVEGMDKCSRCGYWNYAPPGPTNSGGNSDDQ